MKQLIITLLFTSVCIPFVSYRSATAITVEVSARVEGCGDGVIDAGEQCDTNNFGGASCSTLGLSGGALRCTVACTLDASSCTTASSGGNSGGGGGRRTSTKELDIPGTNVVFSGRAYPLSRVSILKDGQLALTTIAGPDSMFSATMSGLSTGNYSFALYSEDKHNVRSSLFTFPIFITSGVTTKISDIFIAPTISVDKSEVKKGDTIVIFGQSIPSSEVTISVHSNPEYFIKKSTDGSGTYLLNFDSSLLDFGRHSTKSKSALNEDISTFSKIIGFSVGTQTIVAQDAHLDDVDVNKDGKVNLVDFSIASYWYKRANPPKSSDVNADGIVDLTDLSIMAFSWTG